MCQFKCHLTLDTSGYINYQGLWATIPLHFNSRRLLADDYERKFHTFPLRFHTIQSHGEPLSTIKYADGDGKSEHSIGSLQSFTKPELRVVNCSEPPTPKTIDRCQVCVERPEEGRRKVVDAQVESAARTKDALVSLSEKPEIAVTMPETLENGTSTRAPRNLVMPCETILKEGPERRTIIRHLENAKFLTGSFRALQRCKSQID